MKKYLILFYLFLFVSSRVFSISVSSTPNPGIVGQNVRFDILANFDYIDFICPIAINFGDSSSWYDVGNCTASHCNLSIDYVYNTPGYYTATVQSNCPATPPEPPDPAFTSVVINCVSLSINSPTVLPEGYLNQSYSYQIQKTGGWEPYVFTLISGSLPLGLSLSPDGIISGIPTNLGNYNFTINLKDSCPTGQQSISANFSLNITTSCPPLTITSPSNLPNGSLNQNYNYQIQTSGGWLPLNFELSNGTLPSGLTLSSYGLISGIPNREGTFNFEVKVTDSCPIAHQSKSKSFSVQITGYELNLNVIPPSFYIPKGEASTVLINYQFNGTQNLNTNLLSPAGYFFANGELIYENDFPLNVIIQNGKALFEEKLSIPFKVVERVINRNLNYFTYKRVFQNSSINLEGILNLFITSEGSSNFSIKRIELQFEDGGVQRNVGRNHKNLKAYALIYFVGSGILEGYWEVDGILLERVYFLLNYGDNLKIETPNIPTLPTFEPGVHKLTFKITSPQIEIDSPSIFYFVNTEEESKILIALLEPNDKAEILMPSNNFKWEEIRNTKYYILNFYLNKKDKPIFSAFTKNSYYIIPESVLQKFFTKGVNYFWEVIGYNFEDKISGKSNLNSFMFKK